MKAHWSPATLSQPGQSPALSSPHAWGPLSPQDAGARLSINHATDRSHLQALSGSWGQIPRGSQCQTKANLEGGTTCQWMPPALKFWLTMVAPPTKPEGHPMQQYSWGPHPPCPGQSQAGNNRGKALHSHPFLGIVPAPSTPGHSHFLFRNSPARGTTQLWPLPSHPTPTIAPGLSSSSKS